MTLTSEQTLTALERIAPQGGHPIYLRGSDQYNAHVQVKNARLHPRPLAIAPCGDATDFSFWLRMLETLKLPISIWSGGHHHEGMCSNDNGIVLLAGPAPAPDIDLEANTVWLGSGQPLKQAIEALGHVGRILPTGGCGTVNVGGLTHGGGWGMSYRTWGLTSDALREVEMVLPNGDIVMLEKGGFTQGTSTSLPVDPVDLFWAIRGGGGGNFGVVTRFKFEIFDPHSTYYTEFTLQWAHDGRAAAARNWVDLCQGDDHNLNIFARMTVTPNTEFSYKNPQFIVGGRYYGDEDACRAALDPIMRDTPPNEESFKEVRLDGAPAFVGAMMLATNAAPRLSGGRIIPPQGFAQQITAPKADGPKETCVETPEPHKVSSLMPGSDPRTILDLAHKLIAKTPHQSDVSLYLSLHGMGGAGGGKPECEGAFPWRDKPYILQVQAWWNPGSKSETEEQALVDWVVTLREDLASQGHGTGAFINFPDRTQSVDTYYGSSWPRLCDIKRQVDPDERLGFAMGIPAVSS
jgi:FAD/FMN-containing dehydrogenase